MIALACSALPDGQRQWSLRVLADDLVRVEEVETIAHETARQTLKNATSRRTCVSSGVWRPRRTQMSSGTGRMSWLSPSARYDPARPVVCLDETSRLVLAEVRRPCLPPPGRPARHDPEDVRGGVINLLLTFEPLQGQRSVLVSAQRTRGDVARCITELGDVRYPGVDRIVLVLDTGEHAYAGIAVCRLPPSRGQAPRRHASACGRGRCRYRTRPRTNSCSPGITATDYAMPGPSAMTVVGAMDRDAVALFVGRVLVRPCVPAS